MLNIITIQGKLCKDVEMKPTQTGRTIAVFCIAVQRNFKNAEGKYEADFIDCVAFDKQGEHINKYFHKGSDIIVTGELQTRTYDDKNGVKHKSAVVNVNKVFFAGGKSESSQNSAPAESNITPDSELPFEME